MKIELSESDCEKVNKIAEISEMNSEVIGMFANYLIEYPCFITKELVEDIQNSCDVSEKYAYFVLFAAACGLDMDKNERDLQIAMNYFIPSIKKLETKNYKENVYYRNISIPEIKYGDWELKYEKYQPYEAFIYNDIIVDKDFREIPQLGFFNEEIQFPAVLESGVEWMTITPNEIETMQPVVDEVKNKIITFGLGLGYFTYMVSEKEQVQSITVVEKNKEIIRLFQSYILPQFPHKDKVRIITMDAFAYAENCMPEENYDYAFVDLWHDVSDGVEMYLKMKRLEHLSSGTKFLYWIEKSILSHIRWYILPSLLDEVKSQNRYSSLPVDNPSKKGLKYQLRVTSSYLKDKEIYTFEEFTYYLSNSFLKKLASDILE